LQFFNEYENGRFHKIEIKIKKIDEENECKRKREKNGASLAIELAANGG